MTYKINGTTLLLQPTTGQWMDREDLDFSGRGHVIYSPIRQYEMNWDVMDLASFQQLYDFYQMQGTTGTVIVDLPYFATGTWTFNSYTGCILHEPQLGVYFEQYHLDVMLIVDSIRT